MHRCPKLLAAMLAAATALGCDLTGPDPGRPIELELRRGTRLSASDERLVGVPVWSSDGDRIYYVARPDHASDPYLATVSAAGGTREILDLAGHLVSWPIPSPLLRSAVPGPAGDVYVVAWTDTVGTARGVLHLAEGSNAAWLPGLDDAITIALVPGGAHLVYSAASWHLASYELATGTKLELPAGDALAFSPDGSELLYSAFEGLSHRISTLRSGAARPVDLGLEGEYPEAIRWTPAGLIVLFTQFDVERVGYDYFLRDVTAGTNTLFYQESFNGIAGTTVLAHDGSKMALFVSKCVKDPGLFSCGSSHRALYVIDVQNGTETWIAGVRDQSFGLPVFSPDGDRVSYTIDGVLYVSSVS